MDDSDYFSGGTPGSPSVGGRRGQPGAPGGSYPGGIPSSARTNPKTPPTQRTAIPSRRTPSIRPNYPPKSTRRTQTNVVIAGGGPKGQRVTVRTPLTADYPTLFFEPLDAFIVKDATFDVDLLLSNSKGLEFDKMVIIIQYNPNVLSVQDFEPQTEEAQWNQGLDDLRKRYRWIAESPNLYEESLDTATGHISIRLHAPDGEAQTIQGLVARLRFVPLVDSGRTALRILTTDPETGTPLTSLTLKGKDLLGEPEIPDDGVLSAVFRVVPGENAGQNGAMLAGDYRTRIRFEPSEAGVSLGDHFDVNVVLDNPREVPFDMVTLVLRYDQRRLRIIDYDQNNWIKVGVNLNDGPYGSNFPFTVRTRNIVSPVDGVILYQSGSPEQAIRTEGVLTTIRFAAIGATPDEGTFIQVGFHPYDPALNSGLFYRG